MMKDIKTGTIEKNEENKKWYDTKGYHMTGETLSITYGDYYGEGHDTTIVYVVFKGSWTRYGTVRDCGNHYIVAGYSSYTRIDKGTFEVTKDVDDK